MPNFDKPSNVLDDGQSSFNKSGGKEYEQKKKVIRDGWYLKRIGAAAMALTLGSSTPNFNSNNINQNTSNWTPVGSEGLVRSAENIVTSADSLKANITAKTEKTIALGVESLATAVFPDIRNNTSKPITLNNEDGLTSDVKIQELATIMHNDYIEPSLTEDMVNPFTSKNYSNVAELEQANKDVFLMRLESLGIIRRINDKIQIKYDLVQREMFERKAGVALVELLQKAGLWDTIVKHYEPGGHDLGSNDGKHMKTLSRLSALKSEEGNKGENRDNTRLEIDKNIIFLEGKNDKDNINAKTIRKQIFEYANTDRFKNSLLEVKQLSEKTGVEFEIVYKIDSYGLENAGAKNTFPEMKNEKLVVTIRINPKYSLTSFIPEISNESVEATTSLSLVLGSISEKSKNEQGGFSAEQILNSLDSSQIMSVKEFQFFTLASDRVDRMYMKLFNDKIVKGTLDFKKYGLAQSEVQNLGKANSASIYNLNASTIYKLLSSYYAQNPQLYAQAINNEMKKYSDPSSPTFAFYDNSEFKLDSSSKVYKLLKLINTTASNNSPVLEYEFNPSYKPGANIPYLIAKVK